MTYAKMLRLNPQIRCLYLGSFYCIPLLRVASQHLQFLEHLHLSFLDDYYEKFGEDVVNFPCVKELKIIYFGQSSTKIPILASCLKEFSFDFHKHPSITKLNLTSTRHLLTINKIYLMDIIKALPLMEEIDISLLKITVNDAIQFVLNCKSLKKLCFKTDYNVDLNHLKEKAGMKCHVVCAEVNELMRYKLYCITIVDNCNSRAY